MGTSEMHVGVDDPGVGKHALMNRFDWVGCMSLRRTYACGGNNTQLSPGDGVRHHQDRLSIGIVLARCKTYATDIGGTLIGSHHHEAYVLWSRVPFEKTP